MKFDLQPKSAAAVSWDTITKVGVVDASDLGMRPGEGFEQLFDDACDVGIALHNPQTGQVTTWYVTNSVVDRDGDIVFWTLLPMPYDINHHPRLRGYRLNVYND